MLAPYVPHGIELEAIPVDPLAVPAPAEDDPVAHVLGHGAGAGQGHVLVCVDHAHVVSEREERVVGAVVFHIQGNIGMNQFDTLEIIKLLQILLLSFSVQGNIYRI